MEYMQEEEGNTRYHREKRTLGRDPHRKGELILVDGIQEERRPHGIQTRRREPHGIRGKGISGIQGTL